MNHISEKTEPENTEHNESVHMSSELNSEPKTSTASLTGSAMVKGFALVGITTGYIFGPLLVLGIPGYYLSRYFDNKIILFACVIVAFFIANILIFTQTTKPLNRLMKKN